MQKIQTLQNMNYAIYIYIYIYIYYTITALKFVMFSKHFQHIECIWAFVGLFCSFGICVFHLFPSPSAPALFPIVLPWTPSFALLLIIIIYQLGEGLFAGESN